MDPRGLWPGGGVDFQTSPSGQNGGGRGKSIPLCVGFPRTCSPLLKLAHPSFCGRSAFHSRIQVQHPHACASGSPEWRPPVHNSVEHSCLSMSTRQFFSLFLLSMTKDAHPIRQQHMGGPRVPSENTLSGSIVLTTVFIRKVTSWSLCKEGHIN